MSGWRNALGVIVVLAIALGGYMALAAIGTWINSRDWKVERDLNSIARTINAKLPTMVDSEIRFDSAEARPDRSFVLSMTLVNVAGADGFDFRIVASPEELETSIRRRADEGFTARVSAGFCWRWSEPRPDGTLVDDVVIGDYRRPWDAKPGNWRLAPGRGTRYLDAPRDGILRRTPAETH